MTDKEYSNLIRMFESEGGDDLKMAEDIFCNMDQDEVSSFIIFYGQHRGDFYVTLPSKAYDYLKAKGWKREQFKAKNEEK